MGKRTKDAGGPSARDEPLTYARAGVDIDAEAATVQALVKALGGGRAGAVQPLDLPGQFAGGVRIGDQALILCTDGVGSKVEIARELGKFDTVGIDCIAMNVNDAICVGAEPVAFVDYLAVEAHGAGFAEAIGRGLAEGARQANVAIVGGETATLPGIVRGFDLAGTCLAIVPMAKLVTGVRVAEGDVIIGLPSSGVHSNGLTLARKAVARGGLTFHHAVPEIAPQTIGDALLTPTRIYVRPILDLLRQVEVHGLVHVTGSGVLNFPRLKLGVRYVLDGWPEPPAIFRAIQRLGAVAAEDMYTTFNMGVGFAVVVPAAAERRALDLLRSEGAFRLGRIANGKGVELTRQHLEFHGVKGKPRG